VRASHSEGDDSGGGEEDVLDAGAMDGAGAAPTRGGRARTGVRQDTKTKRNAKQQAQNKQARGRRRALIALKRIPAGRRAGRKSSRRRDSEE
jgi:hypothetical protein